MASVPPPVPTQSVVGSWEMGAGRLAADGWAGCEEGVGEGREEEEEEEEEEEKRG